MASAIDLHTKLVAVFPRLANTNYQHTSDQTDDYNCIAWAAGDNGRWWWPGRHWPADVPRAVTKLAFIKAFAELGYEVCETPDLEEGFEKVCLYCKLGRPEHAARQLPDGKWTSKLGRGIDISHELEGLRGNKYGQPTLYMRRPRQP